MRQCYVAHGAYKQIDALYEFHRDDHILEKHFSRLVGSVTRSMLDPQLQSIEAIKCIRTKLGFHLSSLLNLLFNYENNRACHCFKGFVLLVSFHRICIAATI